MCPVTSERVMTWAMVSCSFRPWGLPPAASVAMICGESPTAAAMISCAYSSKRAPKVPPTVSIVTSRTVLGSVACVSRVRRKLSAGMPNCGKCSMGANGPNKAPCGSIMVTCPWLRVMSPAISSCTYRSSGVNVSGGIGVIRIGGCLCGELSVDEYKSHTASLARPVSPGMVGAVLDDDVSRLYDSLAAVKDHRDLSFQHDAIVDCLCSMHQRVWGAFF